ncbi:hypothetical protein VspSTUT11_01350 [Vibrio sp. STUT-A11]|nr:hypothetical protein VspSTUT11_01350 [Vibrio sp. STUT-A11]
MAEWPGLRAIGLAHKRDSISLKGKPCAINDKSLVFRLGFLISGGEAGVAHDRDSLVEDQPN